RRIASELRFSLALESLIALQVCLSLFELRLEGPRIDREQMVAILDEIAFTKERLCELPSHLRPYADRRVRFDVADAVDVDRHVALCDAGDHDRDGAAFAAAAAKAAPRSE